MVFDYCYVTIVIAFKILFDFPLWFLNYQIRNIRIFVAYTTVIVCFCKDCRLKWRYCWNNMVILLSLSLTSSLIILWLMVIACKAKWTYTLPPYIEIPVTWIKCSTIFCGIVTLYIWYIQAVFFFFFKKAYSQAFRN